MLDQVCMHVAACDLAVADARFKNASSAPGTDVMLGLLELQQARGPDPQELAPRSSQILRRNPKVNAITLTYKVPIRPKLTHLGFIRVNPFRVQGYLPQQKKYVCYLESS